MSKPKQIQDWELRQRQSLPLEAKILFSQRKIREWIEHWGEDQCSVSFSGGKDSTVLLHLVRSMYPNIPAVFVNTGLEYPEIVSFVQATPNVQIVRPDMDFLSVIRKYGYPVVSKRVSQYVKEVQRAKGDTQTKRLRLTGIHIASGKFQNMSKIPDKWMHLLQAPFKISDLCCKYLKKKALDKVSGYPFIGTMASDGAQRELTYLQHGCNTFDGPRPHSSPLSIWTEADIWAYLRGGNHEAKPLPYSEIYNMGQERTGCMFCMFGVGSNPRPDKFDILAITHPALFRYCMDGPLGLREVMRFTYGREYPASKPTTA